ncbi:MAG: thioredoxin [Bacteroidales bacterium]|nr:MAG: thioredoxin [Bacteroidales bacterium]
MTIVFYIIGGLVLLFIAYSVYSFQKIKNQPAVADSDKVKVLNSNNFAAITKRGIVVVDFWAPWCAPCKMMAPILNDIAESEPDITIAKLNVDNQQQLAAKFAIRGIPTMVIFKNGKEVKRFTGVKTKSVILNEVEKFK